MKVNINAWCEVKLTKHGVDKIKSLWPATLGKFDPGPFKFDKKTKVYRDELWSLMNIFGPDMWMGNNNNPFVNNEIKILERN